MDLRASGRGTGFIIWSWFRGGAAWVAEVAAGASDHVFEDVVLPVGPGRLSAILEDGTGPFGAYQVIIDHAERGSDP